MQPEQDPQEDGHSNPTEEEDNEDSEEEEDSENSLEEEDENVILNEIDGSDEDDYGATYIPKLKTVTMYGCVAGTWQRNFSLLNDSDTGESDCSENEHSSSSDDGDSEMVDRDAASISRPEYVTRLRPRKK